MLSWFGFFFLLVFFFFFFDSWLLVTVLSPDEEEEGEKDFACVECKGCVSVWCLWHVLLMGEVLGAFGTFGMENNQTKSPIVSPGRLRVAIMGGPTFPKHGQLQGSI